LKNIKNIVVVLDHGYISGGAAKVALSSLSHLKNRGLNVHLVYGLGPLDSSIDTKEINCYCLDRQELSKSNSIISAFFLGLWDPYASRSFGEVLSSLDPEDTVIHFHTWTKALSSSVIRKAWSKKFKIVCTLHDFFVSCPNGGFYNYNKKMACNLMPMSLSCILTNCDSRSYMHKVWRLVRQFIQEKFSRMPSKINHFISVSKYSEIILKRFLPIHATISRINNPVDSPKKLLAKPSGAKLFTFIGRLSPEKGADVFALAANLAGAEACFVGEGGQLDLLKGLCPDAIFLGWQNKSGVIRALESSRALIFPSRWHETQGLVVAEAAALGVPSIVSDACAAIDYVEDGKTGLIFISGDVQDLANKIIDLKEAPLKADFLGEAAYVKYCSTFYSIDKHADDLMKCYNDTLNS